MVNEELEGIKTKGWRGGWDIVSGIFREESNKNQSKQIAYCPSITSTVIYFGIAICFDEQAVAQLVEAMRLKLEGRGFDPR
jgi:hypothetical protein